MRGRAALVLGLALTLAGCGGGGGSAVPAPAASAAAPTVAGSVRIQFGSAPSSAARSAQFVSSAAASLTLSVNGVAAVQPGTTNAFFDVSATSPLCTTTPLVRSCAIPVNAPVGTDTFTLTLFSIANGAGLTLGSGTSSVTVVLGTPFNVNIPVSPAVALANGFNLTYASGTSFALGTAASATAAISFQDPAGQTITGTAPFAAPVKLSASDPSVTFMPSTITAPGQTVQVAYNGSTTIPTSITIAATTGSTALGLLSVTVPGLAPTRFDRGNPSTINPNQIVLGPDNNLWWSERGNFGQSVSTSGISTISPSGGVASLKTYPTGFASTRAFGIASGGDGMIWYSDGSTTIARMNPATGAAPASGPATVTVTGGSVCFLATDSQGNVWFVNPNGSRVGYVDKTTFAVNQYVTATASALRSFDQLTLGSDNAMWFTESNTSPTAVRRIGRVSTPANGTAGTTTHVAIPNTGALIYPTSIAAASNGTIWFSAFDGNSNAPNQFFASFTPATSAASITISEYPNVINPAAFANLVTMFAGSDGNMWIAEGGGAVKIPPNTPQLALTQFFTPNQQWSMNYCVQGPASDKRLWCTVTGAAASLSGYLNTNDGIIAWTPR